MRTVKQSKIERSMKQLCHRACLAAIVLIGAGALWGCAEEAGETMNVIHDSAQHTVEASFDAEDTRYVMDCTDYFNLYSVSNGVRSDLEPPATSVDKYNGYFLDGEIIPARVPPPGMYLGCDVLSCLPVHEARTERSLTVYTLVGPRTLTDAEKEAAAETFPADVPVPDILNEYVSSTYSGTIEVELFYYETEDCDAEDAEPLTETQTLEVK